MPLMRGRTTCSGSRSGPPSDRVGPRHCRRVGRDVLAAVRQEWERAVTARAWTDAPVWIHGDLHPANVTVFDGMQSGVIDFGEMCAGDPATDPAAAWLLLPADTSDRF